MQSLDLSPYLFPFLGQVDFQAQRITDGHINDGWFIQSQHPEYPETILQRINTNVFQDPIALMNNIHHVTSFLEKQNPSQKQLHMLKTSSGDIFYLAPDNSYWRLFKRIEGCYTTQITTDLVRVKEAGRVTGEFLKQLADYPVHSLHIPIPDFHNTPKRYQDFLMTLGTADQLLLEETKDEIAFLESRAHKFSLIWEALQQNKIPWRVTHNDTKLDNILFDNQTHKAICLIDLDTIMPGSALFDFGDALRAMGNTAAEDEKNLELVRFQLPVFEAYTQGYLGVTKDLLTNQEVFWLPISPWIITIEIGIRFLTDYLQGDRYFRIHYPKQNLVRARTQFKLANDMEKMLPEMEKIVRNNYDQ